MKNRLETAVNALVQAYENDSLRTASCRKCAVGSLIVHATGQVSDRWWKTLLAFVTNQMDIEDELYASYLQHSIGYDQFEIYLIEAAFEGDFFNPAIRRQSQSQSTSLEDRVRNVVDTLYWIEEHSREASHERARAHLSRIALHS